MVLGVLGSLHILGKVTIYLLIILFLVLIRLNTKLGRFFFSEHLRAEKLPIVKRSKTTLKENRLTSSVKKQRFLQIIYIET